MARKPDLTVAAVIERNAKFLLVEEEVDGAILINQPAGHVEEGEGFVEAVMRETREETAWGFEAESVIGIYLWESATHAVSFLRVAFAGRCRDHAPEQPLDEGIVRTLWLTRDQIAARQQSLRSPMVLRCIDDYLAGARHPLEVLEGLDIRDACRRAAVLF